MKHKSKPQHTLFIESSSEHLSHWLGTLRKSGIRALGPAQLAVLRHYKALPDSLMKPSLSHQELKEGLERELSAIRAKISEFDFSAYGRHLSPDEFSKRQRHLHALQNNLTSLSAQEALEKLKELDRKQLGKEGHLKELHTVRERMDHYSPEFMRLELTQRREELKGALDRLKRNGKLGTSDMLEKFNKNHRKNPVSLYISVYDSAKGVYAYSCNIPKEADIGQKLFNVLPGMEVQFIKDNKFKALPKKGMPALIFYSTEPQLLKLAPSIIEAVYRFFGIQNPKQS